MKFYNREKELEILEKIEKMSENQAQMTTIIGRRRVGKTELIRHFLQKKPNAFYFFVEKKKNEPLLEEFTGILKQKYPFLTNPFKDWNSFFEFIFEISKKEKMIAVFDEFQNFKFVDSSAFSTLQKIWDLNYKEAKLNLILVGSVITLMEKIFRGSKEPLFGRVNHKIYLEPFTPRVIQNLLGDYNIKKFDEFLNFYTVFGGIPKYYAELDNKEQFQEKRFLKIIEEMFFAGDGVLKEEPKDILNLWSDRLVFFLLGCSFSFENAMIAAGLPIRNIEENKNVSMYVTNRDCRPAGPFSSTGTRPAGASWSYSYQG